MVIGEIMPLVDESVDEDMAGDWSDYLGGVGRS